MIIMDEIERQNILKEKAKLIELKPVRSSNIGGIGYDAENKLLKVAFKNKTEFTTYLYEGVESELYNSICVADSIGRALSENVIRNKDKYKYMKL